MARRHTNAQHPALGAKKSRKLKQPSRLQAVVNGITSIPRLTICDKKSSITYLIDTGTDVSVLSKSMVRGTLRPTDYKLLAANNTMIHTYGSQMRVLDLGLKQPYKWSFLMADVKQPIIAVDFLAHHGLLPDLKHRKLIDEQTLLATNA